MRRSARRRSRRSSMLPVPLNSSKITSSMREPVSTSAVARMVSDPPSSMLRAAPKNRFGLCSAAASTPPERILPECGTSVLYARASRVIESSRMTTSRPYSTRRLAFSMTISLTWMCRLAERRADDLDVGPLDGPLHLGDFLGPLVDEQHDDVALRVVAQDAVGHL